jgi:hypothetical protein
LDLLYLSTRKNAQTISFSVKLNQKSLSKNFNFLNMYFWFSSMSLYHKTYCRHNLRVL